MAYETVTKITSRTCVENHLGLPTAFLSIKLYSCCPILISLRDRQTQKCSTEDTSFHYNQGKIHECRPLERSVIQQTGSWEFMKRLKKLSQWDNLKNWHLLAFGRCRGPLDLTCNSGGSPKGKPLQNHGISQVLFTVTFLLNCDVFCFVFSLSYNEITMTWNALTLMMAGLEINHQYHLFSLYCTHNINAMSQNMLIQKLLSHSKIYVSHG